MNIDSLLNLNSGIFVSLAGGSKVEGTVVEIQDEGAFLFSPKGTFDVKDGTMVKVSDGQDSALAKVMETTSRGIRMCIECYALPSDERRQDVRVYDKVYLKTTFLCHGDKKHEILGEIAEKIRGKRLIIESFIKGKYGYPGVDEMPFSRESLFNSPVLWEINRKIDLLIHMFLAEDFTELMRTTPKDVNISASGIRFITKEAYRAGDLLEVGMILPMAPLLYLHLVGDVLRVKPVTSYDSSRYAVAVRFLKMDQDTREDIVRYLFRKQREVLRKRQL